MASPYRLWLIVENRSIWIIQVVQADGATRRGLTPTLYSKNKLSEDIEIKWSFLPEGDERWATTRCLYAYVLPDTKEILYIGKSWSVSARGRWNRSAKENFWEDIENIRGINEHAVILGEPYLAPRRRLTHELLADVESLLIMAEQPWGNIQSKNSRISRPGLVVHCSGDWLGKASHYIDSV